MGEGVLFDFVDAAAGADLGGWSAGLYMALKVIFHTTPMSS